MKLLLVLLGRLRALASAALALGVRHPWPCACAVLLALAWWQWSGKEQALGQRDKARVALATEKTSREAERAGWRRQVAAARAARAAAERKSQEIASDAQSTRNALAADNAGLRAFIAARRVRSGGAVAARPADDLGAPVPADAPEPTLVATDEADLVACDSYFVDLTAAYEWAQGLIRAGLAKSSEKGQIMPVR
jgi:hypothetical protein